MSDIREPLLRKSANERYGGTGHNEQHEADRPAPNHGIIHFFKNAVSVEPVAFLYSMAQPLILPSYRALLFTKVCRQNFTKAICDDLSNPDYRDQQKYVDKETSAWFFYSNLAFEIPSILFALLYGCMSDTLSRKVALILPLFGIMASAICDIINSLHMDIPLFWCIFSRILCGIFGGFIAINLALFSFMGVVTGSASRTARFGVVEGIQSLASAGSAYLGGYIVDHVGYVSVFSIGGSLIFLALLYAVIILREPSREEDMEENQTGCRALCSLNSIKEGLTCIFKQRPERKRAFLLIILLAYFLIMLSYEVMYSLGYLYVKLQPLSWTQTQYGLYCCYASILNALFLLIVLPLLKNVHGVRDTSVLLCQMVAAAASLILYGISTETWMVFVVAVINISHDAGITCVRSLLSYMVEPYEIGKAFAAVGIIQSVGALLGHSLYNNLYRVTVDIWPGMGFAVGAANYTLPLACICWLHINMERTQRADTRPEINN